MRVKSLKPFVYGLVVCAFAGCGGGSGPAGPSPSSGQVSNTAVSTGMTRFAAARAADQVSFGATPALTNTLSQQGLDDWITAQMALPATQMIPPLHVRMYDNNNTTQTQAAYNWPQAEFMNMTLTAQDQLRMRVAWALFQYIPVNGKVSPYSMVQYFNLLQRHAFGNYGTFIRELTINPAMAVFLDNSQNRPESPECPSCAPNENYARELMQLFTLGVMQLNSDGTIKRNSQGKALETYSQEDVEELAGALTGWRFSTIGAPLPASDWNNGAYPMVPEEWAPLHDRNAKTVMGTVFPAGRGASEELDSVVTMLMAHPNIAPFVSLRLIQHLVTSNPTPEYIARVSAKFRNNGSGVAGDMKTVIRAILTDAEARKGDVPGTDTTRFGKFREPILWYTGFLRGTFRGERTARTRSAHSMRPVSSAITFRRTGRRAATCWPPSRRSSAHPNS
jgi:uncharacterized protein (DUF1800 family)